MAGRKTYTEDELQAALRDIQSGKLGTRRAAVIYGIPRSTLRNKVYKMALERDSGLRDPAAGDDPVTVVAAELANEEDDDDDRDTGSAGEEECAARTAAAAAQTADKELLHQSRLHHHVPAAVPRYPSIEEQLFQLSSAAAAVEHGRGPTAPTAEALRLFLEHCNTNSKLLAAHGPEHHQHHQPHRLESRDANVGSPSPPPPPPPPPPPVRLPAQVADLWPAAAVAAAIDPQHMSTYLSRLLQHQSSAGSTSLGSSSGVSRDSPPPGAHDFFKGLTMNEIVRKMLHDDEHHPFKVSPEAAVLRHHQQQQQQRWSSNGCAGEPMDTGRSNDDDSNASNVILRIPSYKPVPGSKQDAYDRDAGAGSPTRAVAAPRSDMSSPPPPPPSGKPPVNLREVIAQSITHKFQQPDAMPGSAAAAAAAAESFARACHQYQQQQASGMPVFSGGGAAVARNHNNNNLLDDRKRVLTPTHSNKQASSSASGSPSGGNGAFQPGSSSNSGSGGKGTRPKRGKYRNYDRDSLVEAVRAVQRGEMSVHRAGSYYGVPHSTLEYKVKERHLMRPRKREPKNPPSASSVSAAAIAEQDRKKDAVAAAAVAAASVAARPATVKSPPAVKLPAHVFPSSQPSLANGLKMFEAGAPVGPYQPSFPFWAPSPFHVPVDFQRNPMQAFTTSMTMMQRIQAETRLHHQAAAAASIASLGKNAREVAENLYDGSDNGSFLDGIIRSSLETGLKSSALAAAAAKSAVSGGGDDSPGSADGPEQPVEGSSSAAERGRTPASAADSASDSEQDEKHAASVPPATSRSPTPPPPPSEQAESDSERAADERSLPESVDGEQQNEESQ